MIVLAIINVGTLEAVLMVSMVSLVIVLQDIPEITVLLVSKAYSYKLIHISTCACFQILLNLYIV